MPLKHIWTRATVWMRGPYDPPVPPGVPGAPDQGLPPGEPGEPGEPDYPDQGLPVYPGQPLPPIYPGRPKPPIARPPVAKPPGLVMLPPNPDYTPPQPTGGPTQPGCFVTVDTGFGQFPRLGWLQGDSGLPTPKSPTTLPVTEGTWVPVEPADEDPCSHRRTREQPPTKPSTPYSVWWVWIPGALATPK